MWRSTFMPENASTVAGEVDALYAFWVGVSIFFSILIAALILYLAVRYRRRSDDGVGVPIHGSTGLEIVWTAIPLVIVLVGFFWGAKVFFRLSRPPADAVEYYATGKQWMWKFQHPDGTREINTLHVAVGMPVKLTMTSEDVIHSFFVPAFRVKMDVLPGRYTTVWFEPTRPGSYHLFCAEYCGAEHAKMGGWIEVMEPHEYEDWLAGNRGEGMRLASGEELFQKYSCHTCHRTDSMARAPILTDLYGRAVLLKNGRTVTADENYVRESILDPAAKVVEGYQPVMPTFQGQMSEEEVLQLVRYIRGLDPGAQHDGTGPPSPGPRQTVEGRR
ncbi:MAG: cytochrome c oxidase subunit II [Candidatus Krumholzibacteriia bacterium]